MAAIKALQDGLGPETTSGWLSGALREGSREERSLDLRRNRETKEDEIARTPAR
ncbi:hypothetical protein KOR34_53160 [Posidoniimonas corsicana]|uniref:Uncharacterized protein n=1 Tax=Posidoniimonas corsicana TaxID=1938618 RepID=A0A5C5UU36_9BACT|nr:hypothetical protein KOR34_53160 [Posidoniimonas corsicana]